MSNIFKNSNKNSRFDSLIEEEPVFVEKRQNSFLNNNPSNMQSSSLFMSGNNNRFENQIKVNNPTIRSYSNMFVDPKTEKERQIKQQQLIENEKNQLAIKNAFDQNNFSESLIKNKSDTSKETHVKPLSFLEKAKLGAEKKEPVKLYETTKFNTPIMDIQKKQVNPFFKSVVNALVDLHEREEIKERNRLGDDRYEEKYGINDENYMDYFDMLDELAESDSDYDEEPDFE
jgi:hypothetical protein